MVNQVHTVSCLECVHHSQVSIENSPEGEHNCLLYPDTIGAFPNSCYNARHDALMCGRNARGFQKKREP